MPVFKFLWTRSAFRVHQSVWLWRLYLWQTVVRAERRGDGTRMENHAALWTNGDMAHRLLTSPNRFSARFAFIFTISLSCTYLCYSILFCRGTIMTNQAYEGKRCAPSKNAGGKKLLGKLEENCASVVDVRGVQRDAAGSTGSHWSEGNVNKNLSVAQKYGNKKLPNALIVGVKKGGTRAVLEFIRIHPDVRALGTEPHFFDRNYDRGLDWYRWEQFFGLNGQINSKQCVNASFLVYIMWLNDKSLEVRVPCPCNFNWAVATRNMSWPFCIKWMVSKRHTKRVLMRKHTVLVKLEPTCCRF